jgi:hypothetical protein
MFSACVAFPQQFWGAAASGQQLEPENAAVGDVPEGAFWRINLPVKIRLRSPRTGPYNAAQPAGKRPQR